MSPARFGVRNPVAANLLMWALVLGGIYSWVTLVRELLPNSTPEAVSVTVPFPGATPDEVSELVTRRLEEELREIDGVDEVSSRVTEGLSVTRLDLEEGAARDRVLADVRNAVDLAKPDLPDTAEDPIIAERRPNFPVISVMISGDIREDALRGAAEAIDDELRDLEGVSEVRKVGVREPELIIELDPARLERWQLTFSEVGHAVQRSNLDVGAGQLKGEHGQVRVRTLGREHLAQALERLVVAAGPDGEVVRLADVATVREGFSDQVLRGRWGGKRSVAFYIFKTPEQDAIQIADEVTDYARTHPDRLGGAATVETTLDLSRFIRERLELMLRNARQGLVLVLLALAIFLELRVAFWVAVGIPVSFLGTFMVMQWFGQTVNLLTLLALIVVLGLIVDDAIVIGENVFSRLRAGEPPLRAAVEGTDEVALPVVAAVTTTIVAFIPLAFIEGRVGDLFGALPIVVIAALSMSLLEAFVILPAHLAHMKTTPPRGILGRAASALAAWRSRLFEERLPGLLERGLRVIFRWRYVALAVTLAGSMAAAGLVAGGVVPFVLYNELDSEMVVVDLEMAAGTTEDRTEETLAAVERALLAMEEVKSTFTVVGASFNDEGLSASADPATVGQITVELLGSDERQRRGMRTSREVLAVARRETAALPGVKKLVFESRSGGPVGADLEARLTFDGQADVAGATAWVREVIRSYDGVDQIEDDLGLGKLEVRARLKDAARGLGLATADLAMLLRDAVFGLEAQELQRDDDRVKVRVRLPEDARRSLSDLLALKVRTPSGARVPLGEVCDLEVARGVAELSRVDGRRAVTVRAEVDEDRANIDEVSRDLEVRVQEVGTRFPGARCTLEGRRRETQESMRSLAIGFPAALLMIYGVIAILFRSYIQPIVVMVAIPFSLVGAVVGHLVWGSPFTLLSMIGCVALAGIVVNDSLILVDFINRARRAGQGPVEAAVLGAKRRFRAILLTSITTVAGLAPLLLETSFQAQFLIPMAISLVFGLAFATVLTVALIPTLYLVLDDLHRGARWLGWAKGPAPGAEAAPVLAAPEEGDEEA